MPQIQDEIIFPQSGLDWDSDERYLTKGDSDYRLNIRPNAYGADYVLTNLEGNTEVTHSFTHDTDNYSGAIFTCIGDCYDPVRDAVYLFIYSSLGNDSILRFNFSDSSFDKICFDHTNLGFDIKYPITDAYMIGDRLHWNPRTSSPRAINVQWAYYDHITYIPYTGTIRAEGDYVRLFNKVYKVLAPNDNTYPPAHPEQFEFVDYAYGDVYYQNATDIDATVTSGAYYRTRDFFNIPTVITHAPNVEVGTDTGYEYNNIRGRRFQFCYRHYIQDQGYTISSQYTDIIAAPASETTYGDVVRDIDAFNKIDIEIIMQNETVDGSPWYKHYMLFEFIEVLFREGPDDSWKVAERVNYEEMASNLISTGNDYYPLTFYNDKSYEVVDTASIEKQYNALPIKAEAQWSLDGERCAYGGVTEGYDAVVDMDVTMTVGRNPLTLDAGDIASGALETEITFSETWDDVGPSYTQVSSIIEVESAAATNVIIVTVNGIEYRYSLVAADVATDQTYAWAVRDLVNQAGLKFYVEAYLTSYRITRTTGMTPPNLSSVLRYATGITVSEAYKVGSFKNGAWHPFCLFYYDSAGRRSEPLFNADMRVYVESLPELTIPASESTNQQRTIAWEIDHLPPAWATHWRWGYAGNQTIGKFWQYNVKNVEINITKGTGNDDWTRIDITPLQNLADDTDATLDHYFPNSVIDPYTYEPGDRLRFITSDVATPTAHTGLTIATAVEDYEILEFNDVDNYIFVDERLAALSNDANTIIVEIYRPLKQTGTTIYYEFGQLHETYLSGGVLYHMGENVDQTASLAAEGEFTNGDVYVITRTFSLEASDDNVAFVESYGWSDFHETEGWAKGKEGIYTGIGQKYLNNVRYGNRYSPNSQTSGLSTFDFLDYKELGFDHGKITALRQAGHTLKVIFERNTASIMVNKTQFLNADGVSQVLKSDQVLGSVEYSNYHYGTVFPESVCLKDRTIYFFDVYRDALVRDSANGIEPISDYKMRRYFKEKSEIILSTGISNVRVNTIFDYDFDTLIVVFDIGEDTDEDNCIMFHEPSNRWTSFMNCEIEETQDGPIFSLTSPEYSNTDPNLLFSASFSYGEYSSTISAVTTANDTFGRTFTGTNFIPLTEGAEIEVTAYVLAGADTSISDVLDMLILTPDGVTELTMSSYIGSANEYTFTHTATQSGYFHITFRVSGVINVTAADAATVIWNAEYTNIIKPKFGRGISNLVSYINEDVWIHNSNTTRNNLWGTQQDSVVRVVSNANPNIIKEFLAMAIHSNKPWDVTNIQIPATISYPDGMLSVIPEAHFEVDEGVLRSDYLCNMKTVSGTASVTDLLNGDNLRGYIISHDLTNDDTTEVYLFKVDVSSNVSKM